LLVELFESYDDARTCKPQMEFLRLYELKLTHLNESNKYKKIPSSPKWSPAHSLPIYIVVAKCRLPHDVYS